MIIDECGRLPERSQKPSWSAHRDWREQGYRTEIFYHGGAYRSVSEGEVADTIRRQLEEEGLGGSTVAVTAKDRTVFLESERLAPSDMDSIRRMMDRATLDTGVRCDWRIDAGAARERPAARSPRS